MPAHTIYDVVILGCGPAGIQAAIHAARKKTSVLILGRLNKSSLFWAHVENFLGMFKTSGEEMLRTGLAQAKTKLRDWAERRRPGVKRGEYRANVLFRK